MALGILEIIFTVLIIMAATGQFLLYRNGGSRISNSIILIWNTVLGIIISYLVYTSLPSNYTVQKVLALVWGITAIVAFILELRNKETLILSKIMLTVSVVGGIIHLLI